MIKDTYNLRFGNGQCLSLAATADSSGWLEKFASILELERSLPDGHSKVVFSRKKIISDKGTPNSRNELADILGKDVPADAWSLYDARVLKIWYNIFLDDVICEISAVANEDMDIIQMWHALYSIYIKAQRTGGVPLHAGLIERDGRGIVIAAPGNTGKSTCCRRIPPPRKALCDDEVLIIYDKIKGYLAHPFPTWSDYLWKRANNTWKVEKNVALDAVFFLEQAPVDEVEPVGGAMAAALMNLSAHQAFFKGHAGRNPGGETGRKKDLFNNVCRLVKAVPSFKLRCTLDGEFWVKIEEALCARQGC
ncbi:MAG: SynChlorMet cassette protein ScmC [Candidatus Omnitrophota bacterium]